MPRYTKGKGKLQRKQKWKGFKNLKHMEQWLTRTSSSDAIWVKHFKNKALSYNNSSKPFIHPRTLRKIHTQTPVKLAGGFCYDLEIGIDAECLSHNIRR